MMMFKYKNKTFDAKVIWNKLRHKINGSPIAISWQEVVWL